MLRPLRPSSGEARPDAGPKRCATSYLAAVHRRSGRPVSVRLENGRPSDSGPTRRNRVEEESPYLRQHADNPVNWQPWVERALEAATERDVPIFLSIGYSACHWWHVMEAESFEDEAIAEVLNENFVPIKVNREERPDVDSIYMTVCQLAIYDSCQNSVLYTEAVFSTTSFLCFIPKPMNQPFSRYA